MTPPDSDPSRSSSEADAPAEPASTAAQALAAAGDAESARDVGALDDAALAAQKRLGKDKASLVERLIYGPAPESQEFSSGEGWQEKEKRGTQVVEAAVRCMHEGHAFAADGKLSEELRRVVAKQKGYGFTVPAEFGGLEGSYIEFAIAEEELSANGLGPLAVELSGELTIGAGSLQGYGTDEQKSTFLPMIAEGQLMGFGLTEVKVGVNAKKVRAYVDWDEASDCWRLNALADRNKLYITNATYGGLVGIVARLGRTGKKVGLFIVRLPESDVERAGESDFGFSCASSGVDAFVPNYNARLSFDNFPIPKENRIEGDGVEVLFYCLRMGRCMLASMSAGYQRMFAADACYYAIRRDGVGGPVIRHELPRLALGKMLGGALQARALSHLSLEQDAAGVDLAGLRDLTKSAASTTAMESLIACERVLGGRSFDKNARVSAARSNMHVFGVVEGEDDLILMGMVKDITGNFVDTYMAGLLGALQSINVDDKGKVLPAEERILRITPQAMLKYPGRCLKATGKVLTNPSFWSLVGWIGGNAVKEVLRLPGALIPASWNSRYARLPVRLRRYAKAAERGLQRQRWSYLGMNLHFQLQLTRTQIPLQRFGKRIEHWVSMLALAHHVADKDVTQQRVAELQCELLRGKAQSIRVFRGLYEMERLSERIAAVAGDLQAGENTLLSGIDPEMFAHPWEGLDPQTKGASKKGNSSGKSSGKKNSGKQNRKKGSGKKQRAS